MSNVKQLFDGKVTSDTEDTTSAVHRLDFRIVAAVQDAISAGVPQGLIVGVLAGHTHQQTARMVDNAD